MMIASESKIKLADRIWIAVALLHRETPDREGFSADEIRRKLRETGLMEGLKPVSVNSHLGEHMVANKPPTGTKYIMLHKTNADLLRLYRPGDLIDPGRNPLRPNWRRPLKSVPRRDEIPVEYLPLLDWYATWSNEERSEPTSIDFENDPLIRLIGSGKHIWADEHADEYVENLRREEPA